MVPVPAEPAGEGPPEYREDFWSHVSPERPSVELTCLLPNGVIILLKVNYNATLAEIKEELWEKATRFPLYGKLHDMSVYIFKFINSMAEEEELPDESKRLYDIKPIGAVLIVSEVRGTSIDHAINVSIGHLVGKGLQEFDALNSSEINTFRFKMRKMGEEIAKQRGDSWQEKLICQYPLRVTPTPKIDDSEKTHHGLDQIIQVQTICEPEYETTTEQDTEQILERSFKFNIPADTLPNELIAMNLAKSSNALIMKNDKVTDYVLKACGREEYLLGDYKLIDFHYIQECLLKDIVPSLLLVHINKLPVVNRDYDYLESFDTNKTRTTSYNSNTLRKKKNTKSSWTITDNYAITLCTATRLNYDIVKPTELGIQAGLFHGGRPLCQPLKTDEQLVCQKDEVDFDVSLEFDIQVCNIPRNTKLCIVIYEVNKGNDKGTKPKKPKDPKENQIIAIAWGNTAVYDFKGQLKSGATTLYMWTYAEDIMPDDLLNPLGTVVNNPYKEYSTALTLIFKSYEEEINFMYPCTEAIMEYARNTEDKTGLIATDDIGNCKRLFNVYNVYDLHDQDRKKIWSLRKYWMHDSPDFFPKLLCCIDWDKRDDISQVMVLLREWPKLPIAKSLELLDYAYPDQEVRSFAVQCLQDVSDGDLSLYLLQLVQAIKHELYLECDLVTFLLRRGLYNRHIGQSLFWHLRSDMHVASVSVRFGLILEAYFRGNQDHIQIIQKEVNLLDLFKRASELVRDRKDKEKTKIILKQFLSNCEKAVRSPLDPCLNCKRIKVEKCRVMDSKMKPLWVVFENADKFGEDIYLIFKNGDDLRQDMLTLQMLRIMDRLWKSKGLDLRLTPYNCISLDNKVGMIEVVLHAETIANIQKEKGIFTATAAFRKGPILAWLKDYNTTEASLNKAIEEFTYSCAGYCVATYVLGIADRHSDNIMLKRNGQMFHIDFGHILGHFKEKFGIKRERVPFVLTHDFVHVINKGQKPQPSALEFRMFQSYCEKAFLILRENANLIISLFSMMISTGLPELSSEKDLQYLRESLALSKTDEEAAAHFKSKFDEALSNSWKTSLNWASHNISKNNKA